MGVSWLNVYILRSVGWVFRGCWLGIHRMFATCSLSVRYIFAIQKYGFCVAKVWFLACKKGVFTLQKYGFCFLNVVLLQSVSNIIGRLLAAVGADLSRPHIGIHP